MRVPGGAASLSGHTFCGSRVRLGAHPRFQLGHQRRAVLPTRGQAPLRALAVDRPLEVEQRVDPLDRLQRQRRDRRRVLAAFGIGRDISQDKELATRMSPTGCIDDPARLAIRPIQPVVSSKGVGLEDAGKADQVLFVMLRGCEFLPVAVSGWI